MQGFSASEGGRRQLLSSDTLGVTETSQGNRVKPEHGPLLERCLKFLGLVWLINSFAFIPGVLGEVFNTLVVTGSVQPLIFT